MNLLSRFKPFPWFQGPLVEKSENLNPRQVILTQACLAGVQDCLKPEIRKSHEGIVYLLGQTNGATTLTVSAVRPEAITTLGSFSVSSLAMARVVRIAANFSLQVVGQLHTHPRKAYHSDGDNEGARIRYTGYISVVLPDYGRHLPDLAGSATYMFDASRGFIPIEISNITVVPGKLR